MAEKNKYKNKDENRKPKGLRFIQTNLNRNEAAVDLFAATITSQNAAIVVICEPNKKMVQKKNFCCDKCCDVAILVSDKETNIANKSCDKNFVACDVGACIVYVCYILPNASVKTCKKVLEKLLKKLG